MREKNENYGRVNLLIEPKSFGLFKGLDGRLSMSKTDSQFGQVLGFLLYFKIK